MNTRLPANDSSEARRHLADTFRFGELVWLSKETYDPDLGMWHFDVLRQGNFGQWACQRYRFDEAADVLYFLGETHLTDDQFRAARTGAALFSTPERS